MEKPCRLFCLPFAGAGAAIYRAWLGTLGPDVEICALELPGRGTRMREASFLRMDLLAIAVAEAMRPRLDRPFALFGHSMGALLSFEIARVLRRTGGASPIAIFASAHRAPHLPDPDPPMRDMPRSELVNELRRLGGTPADVLDCAEMMDLALPILRADFTLTETYAYRDEPPLGCPIIALAALDDVRAPRQGVAAWDRHTRDAFRLRLFTGDHFFVQNSRAAVARAVAEDLRIILRKPALSAA